MEIDSYKSIYNWAKDLDGVFTIADLKVALEEDAEATLYRRLNRLVQTGTLLKVKRGVYATPDATLTTISSRIAPQSYISTGTVLAQKAIIGSIPARRVQAIKTGRPRTYQCEQGTIEHLSINPKYYFGFEPQNGMLWATPEKAFLDVCYYYYKGKSFSFDPGSDINLQRIDLGIVTRYLEKYDQRFVTFFNSHWGVQ
ncbi:type IV toxin-antitoxin system AbiEi family antitoxin domain-containing protein [Planctomycetota bacterium]